MAQFTFKRVIAAAVTAAAVTMMLAGSAAAQSSSDGLSVSVTPSVTIIALTGGDSNNTGQIAFGTKALSGTFDTAGSDPADGNADTITVSNSGTLAVATLLLAYDVANPGEGECGATDWQASASAAGADTFRMRATDDATFDGTGDHYIPAGTTNSADVLDGAGITSGGGTKTIDLELEMPTSVTTGTNECTIAMTFTATG